MENNPTGENNSQNPTVAPTMMSTEMAQEPTVAPVTADTSGVPIGGGVNAEVAREPSSVPTEAALIEQNAGMAPGAMPAGASLRPETMQSQKVTKSIKLPGAKKSHKGLVAAIIIVLVLALGAGVAWWFLAGPGKEEGKHGETHWPCTSEDPGLCLNGEGSDANGDVEEGLTETEITPEEEERRVREVVEMMRARAVEFLAEKGLTNDIALTEISEGSGIRVRPNGWGAAVDATKSIRYGVVDGTNTFASWEWVSAWNDVLSEADVIAQAFFEENGFQSYGWLGAGNLELRYNPETGVQCIYGEGGAMSELACAYETWVDESQKEMVNQMAAGYLAGTGNEIIWVGIDMSHLENSSVAPYQRIWVSIPNAAADFYRVSPETEWKFFSAGQSAPFCEEYNTDELKNAYAGASCFVEQGNSDMSVVEAAN